MKVLKYDNRSLFDISTPEKEAAGYLRLFKELDEDGVYDDLEEGENLYVCEACTDGQHKYCKGRSSSCSCDASPDCANHNYHAVARRERDIMQLDWHTKAQEGDWMAAKKLMAARHWCDGMQEVDVIDPLLEDISDE